MVKISSDSDKVYYIGKRVKHPTPLERVKKSLQKWGLWLLKEPVQYKEFITENGF